MHANLTYLVAQQHIYDLHTAAVRERLAQTARSTTHRVPEPMPSQRRWLRPLLRLPVSPSSQH